MPLILLTTFPTTDTKQIGHPDKTLGHLTVLGVSPRRPCPPWAGPRHGRRVLGTRVSTMGLAREEGEKR